MSSDLNASSRYRASGSSLPGGLVVLNWINAWSRATVSVSTRFQSGLKQRLYLPGERVEGESPRVDAFPAASDAIVYGLGFRCPRRRGYLVRDLFSRVSLTGREQLRDHP